MCVPKSIWAGGLYRLTLAFPAAYPSSAPIATFRPAIPHPNVFSSGQVCLDLLTSAWKPSITLRQVLLGLQALLDEPNLASPANGAMERLLRGSPKKYEATVAAYAHAHRPAGGDAIEIL